MSSCHRSSGMFAVFALPLGETAYLTAPRSPRMSYKSISSLRISANIFQIWLIVAGFEKLAGEYAIRKAEVFWIIYLIVYTWSLRSKYYYYFFFCQTRQVTVLRVYFTPRRICTLQPWVDFIAFSESVHTNRIFLRTAFCQHETSESAHRNRIFLKPLRVV